MPNKLTDEQLATRVLEEKGVARYMKVDKALKYYKRDPYGTEEPGRSSHVSGEVYQAVEWAHAQMLDVFFGGEQIGEFSATAQGDVDAAQQETRAVEHEINDRNEGYLLFNQWFKDALLHDVGVIKVWWDPTEPVAPEHYDNKKLSEYIMLASDDSVEIKALTIRLDEQEVEGLEALRTAAVNEAALGLDGVAGEEIDPTIADQLIMQMDEAGRLEFDIDVERKLDTPQVRIENVVPGSLYVAARWHTLDLTDCPFVAEKKVVRAADLVADGMPVDKVKNLPDAASIPEEFSTERFDQDDSLGHPTVDNDSGRRMVEIIDAYLQVEDGPGKTKLVHVIMGEHGGSDADNSGGTILLREDADGMPYCAIAQNIMPHTFWGVSKAEEAMPTQFLASHLSRHVVDNIYQVNQPTILTGSGSNLDVDALMSGQQIVRGGDVSVNAIRNFETPFIGDKALAVLGFFDERGERTTGLNKASMGLDTNALSKTTNVVGTMLMNVSQLRIKLAARNFAETGVKQMYLRVHELLRKHAPDDHSFMQGTQEIAIHPREWKHRKAFKVRVGIGHASKLEKTAMLDAIINRQSAIFQAQGGPGPLLGLNEIHNALTDEIRHTGGAQPDRYYTDPANYEPPAPKEEPLDKAMDIEEAKVTAKAQTDAAQLELDRATHQDDVRIKLLELELKREELALEREKLDLERQKAGATVVEKDKDRAFEALKGMQANA